MRWALPVIIVPLLALSGCASIIDGALQTITVKVVSAGRDVPDANCVLTNNKGSWEVTTPAVVVVHRSLGDLAVSCARPGYLPNVGSVPSTTRNLVWGNVVFGLVVGATIDMADGDAYDYPTPIIINLQPVKAP